MATLAERCAASPPAAAVEAAAACTHKLTSYLANELLQATVQLFGLRAGGGGQTRRALEYMRAPAAARALHHAPASAASRRPRLT